MHKFTDNEHREWKLELSIGLVEEINDELDVNLFEPVNNAGEDQVISKISPIGLDSLRRFANVLFMICEDQCKELEVDSKAFGKALKGSVIQSAYESFYAEWMDFFQILGRVDLAETIQKVKDLLGEDMKEIAKKIKEITMAEVKEASQKLGSKE